MSSRTPLIPPSPAAYMSSKHASRANDEESGSHTVSDRNHSQPSAWHNILSADASSIMSLSSRTRISLRHQAVSLDVLGHKIVIQLPGFQRQHLGKITHQAGHELPLFECRPDSVGPAPGLIEPRRPPTGPSDHTPRTTEAPKDPPVTLSSSATETPITCKKRAGRRIVRGKASPPNPVVERRDEICDVLKPLPSTAPFILLCQGKEQDAVISAINLPDGLDPTTVWAKLSVVARQCTRRWKRLLGPVRLELVNLKIVGQHAQRSGAFRGQFQIVNVAERIEKLQQLIDDYECYLTEPSNPDMDEYDCYHDLATDRVLHGYEVCSWAWGDDHRVNEPSCCDVQMHVNRLKELSKLKMASTWNMLLSYPKLAVGNDVLYDKWIYSSKDILPPVKTAVVRAVADMEFVGFRIVEWPYTSFSTPSVTLLVGSTVVFGLFVIVSQAIYRDWGVAYTAGAFYVALAGVLTTWVAWTSTA